MKTIPYLTDLPMHQAPRIGRVCPRCHGSVVTFYPDEAPQCLACGFIPIVTRSAAESISYLQSLETRELMANGGRPRHAANHGGIKL